MARDDERPYELDDLIAHEKGQMRLVLLVMVLAMLYFAGQRLMGPSQPTPAPDAAPVTSSP